jgi:hypothetical protein
LSQCRPGAVAPLSGLSTALLAQHLPNFNGENLESGDGEAFSEWLERLLFAVVCKWSDQTKLVNLATRLRGSKASRFYRSCTPRQRSSYQELVSALCNRFTPVHIQSVHSSILDKRKQRAKEKVDDYA